MSDGIRCRNCGVVKPYSEYPGKHKQCRSCRYAKNAEYHRMHRDQIRTQTKMPRDENGRVAPTPQQVTRFWSHVEKREPGSCWPWTAKLGKNGYGCIFNSPASRVAWIVTHGDPGELNVLHQCDNPACCNPNHLFLGTRKDNSEDMVHKGRQARGEKNSHHKLSVSEVVEIRTLYAQGNISYCELGRRYHVAPNTIRYLVLGKTWRDIPVLSPQSHPRRHSNSRRQKSDEDNPMITCACGCGQTFPKFDSDKRPRAYVSGHNPRKSAPIAKPQPSPLLLL